jgi:hypothetical protein
LEKSAVTKSVAKLPTDGKQFTKLGRPTETVDPVEASLICDWIAHGKTLREYCRQKGKVKWRTIYKWLEKDEAFRTAFARARDTGCEILFEECLELIDTPPVYCGSDGNERIDPAFINWQKNRVETRFKMLSKFNPKRFGDKLGVDAKGDISLTISTGVPQA